MSINTYNITENKKKENTKSKKDNILDIKQNLFQQMTTQSSTKFKNRDNDENTFSNQKYQKNKNLKNYEENNSIYYDNEEKSIHKDSPKQKNNKKSTRIKSEKNKNKNKIISAIRNDNDIMAYFSKTQNKNAYPLNDSSSNENEKNNNFDTDKFYNNNDLIYVLSTQKEGNKNTNENDTELDSYERLTSHVALPFCHYHKYNIKLPKQYTCNFKNCSCCGCLGRKKLHNLQDSNSSYKNKPDYIYPVINSEKKKTKYRSVLDKFRKNKNSQINTLSGESNQLGDSQLAFLKPNNTNLKISKKDYIIENSNDDSDFIDNDNNKENGKNYYYIDNNIKNDNDYNLNDENRIYGDNKSKNGNEYYNYNNNNNDNITNNDNDFNDSNFNENSFIGDNFYKNGNKYYKKDNVNNDFNYDDNKDKNENNSQSRNTYSNKDENDEINNIYTNNENYRNKDGNDYNVYNNIYGDNKIETEYNNNSNENNNDSKNDDNDYIKNRIDNRYKDDNFITEKESENYFNESSLLELPYNCNDDTNLNKYKHLVNKSEKKPKIHFSVLYYKRLNKSFNQIYSKDFKDKRSKSNIIFKGVNKNKTVEFLRE